MCALGYYAAFIGSCLPPPPEDAPYPYLFAMFLNALGQAVGASLAITAIGSIPPHHGLPRSAFQQALSIACIGHVLGVFSPALAVFGAIRGFGRSMTWRPLRPQRRQVLTVRKRLALLVLGTGMGYGCMMIGLYQHGGAWSVINGKRWDPTPISPIGPPTLSPMGPHTISPIGPPT